MSRTLENKITGYLQSGPKTLTEIRLYFGSKFDAKGELIRMVDKGIIACEPGQKAPGKRGVPPTVYSLIDNSTASVELIDSPAFFALLGCVQQGQKIAVSHKVKDQLWATERANIWRTLHVMGKLKKQ